MNYLQIIGFALITIGTIISFVGSYQQSTKDDYFKSNVTEYVEKKKEEQIPILKILRVTGINSDSCKLVVKNIGTTTAYKPTLVFSEKSFPNAFTANGMYSTEEIPQGVEYTFTINLFEGISLLAKLPNDDQKYKEDLLMNIEEFKKGKKSFIPRFYLEYYFNNEKITSETYMLIVNFKNGIVSFSKD